MLAMSLPPAREEAFTTSRFNASHRAIRRSRAGAAGTLEVVGTGGRRNASTPTAALSNNKRAATHRHGRKESSACGAGIIRGPESWFFLTNACTTFFFVSLL